MKKIYLAVAAALFATCAQAQTLQFMFGDKILEPGQTIEFNEAEIIDEPDYYSWAMKPDLYIVGSEADEINVNVNCETGQSVMFCMGGSCKMGSTVSTENYKINANTPESLEFHIEGYDRDIPADVITHFTAFYTYNDDVLAEFTLIMNKNGVVKTATLYEEGEELFSVNGELKYNVNGTSDLTLYTTDGRRVLNQTVSGNGSVSTAALANGVYVYTLGTKSGKVIVK